MAKDKALFDKAQVGDKIRFVVNVSGTLIVTVFQPDKWPSGRRRQADWR